MSRYPEVIPQHRQIRKTFIDSMTALQELPEGYIEKELDHLEDMIRALENYMLDPRGDELVKKTDEMGIIALQNLKVCLAFIRTMHSAQKRMRAELKEAIDAIRTEKDEKLKALSEQLSKAPTLTKEQADSLSLFKKAMDEMAAQDKRGQAPYV